MQRKTLSGKVFHAFFLDSNSWNSDHGGLPKRHCFGSVAKSLMSCYVPVAFLLVLDLEVEGFGGWKQLTVVYTFPEAVTSFVLSISTISLLIDHLQSIGT